MASESIAHSDSEPNQAQGIIIVKYLLFNSFPLDPINIVLKRTIRKKFSKICITSDHHQIWHTGSGLF